MMYTSRFYNPELKQNTDKYAVVRISCGYPRWLSYKPVGYIEELAPVGLIKITDRVEFARKYLTRLDQIGVETIAQRLDTFRSLGKPVVLCCYEDIRKGGDQWCHRTLFANWWRLKTDERIDELADPSKFKPEYPDSKTPFRDLLWDFVC